MKTSNEVKLKLFHIAFKITPSIIFEVNYYKCGSNETPHFSTSAAQFNRPKTDYNQCGQAQKSLLTGAALQFYRKFDHLHLKDLDTDKYLDIISGLERLKKMYMFVEVDGERDGINFSTLRELSMQKPPSKLPEEVLQARKERAEQRRKDREQEKERARVEAEKNQRPVKAITITIEWRKSRTWGSNPVAEAIVSFADGHSERSDKATASGYGYDKESTVIAEIFNRYLRYKLWNKTANQLDKKPYGINVYGDNSRSYAGGVGTSCYYSIAEFIGGKFERIASGKTFDVYKYSEE